VYVPLEIDGKMKAAADSGEQHGPPLIAIRARGAACARVFATR
jgi:hypothetical protein